MTLYRVGLPTYDPISPEASEPTILHQTACVGVVLPASPQSIAAFDKAILDDPLQRRNFRLVMLAGAAPGGSLLPFDPQALDILKTNEGNYHLLGATGLNPAGDGNILWNLGCTLDTQLDIAATLTFEDTNTITWELISFDPDADVPATTFQDSQSVAWEIIP